MTWFKIDDQFSRHRKTRRLMNEFDAGNVAMAARLLWEEAGVQCGADNQTERAKAGVVESWKIADHAYHVGIKSKPMLAKALAALVAVGLWHDHETIRECEHGCGDIVDLAEGDFYFHDWNDWQIPPGSEPYERFVWRRNKQLHSSRCAAQVEEIKARDRDLCRYCGQQVNWQDRRGPLGATYDHLDPRLGFGSKDTSAANSPRNVVVACRRCNAIKKDRTPDDAGMPLLPAGTSVTVDTAPEPCGPGEASQPEPGPDPDLAHGVREPAPDLTLGVRKPDPDLPPRSRDGNGVGPGQVRVQVGSGRDGPGSDRAGPGRDGPGQDGSGRERAGPGRNGHAAVRAPVKRRGGGG